MADILPTADEAFAPAPEDTRPTADDAFGAAPQAPAPAPIYHSPKSYPAAVNARIEQGVSINDLFKAGAEGAKAGWNNPDIPPSVSGLQSWVDRNVNVGPLRLFNEALTNPAIGAYNLLARGLSAGMGALQGAGAEVGQQVGKVTGSPLLGNDISAALSEYPGAELAGIAPHVSRVEVGPDGLMRDGHIGPIPHPTEVPAQAKGIADIWGLRAPPGFAQAEESIPRAGYGATRDVTGETVTPQYVSPSVSLDQRPGAAVTSLPNVHPDTFKLLSEEAGLREKHADITAKIAELPEGDPTAVDRLARLDAVETQLKDENLSVADRKSLNDRRDQILVDTTPEKLKEAAAPIEQRRVLEAQQAAMEQRLGEIGDTHAKALEEAALTPKTQQSAAQVIERLYHEDGVLPAEVHRDAQLDPTVIADLAIGEKPERYAHPDPHLTAILNARLDAAETPEGAAAVLSSEQAAVDRRLGGDDILKDAIEQEDSLGQLPGVYTQEGPGAARSAATDTGQPRPTGSEPAIAGAGDTASATLEQGGGATRVAGRSQLLKPIKGTGELKTRGLSEHIEASATERGLTDGFGDLPGYRTLNMAEQSRLWNDLLARDPQLAMDVAMGRKPAPNGMIPEGALVAVEKAATAAGDVETLRDLVNTRLATDATTMGQRIRTLGERDPNSAVGAMRMVNDAREAKIKPYLIEKEIAKVTKDASKAIRAAAPKMDAWQSFLAELECK